MFEINSEVLRKTGNSQKGIVQAVRGTLVQVAWQDAVNRRSGNKVTRMWVKADRLIPYNENTAAFRSRQQQIKHLKSIMELYYPRLMAEKDDIVEHRRVAEIMAGAELEYSRLCHSDYQFGQCHVCKQARLLDKGICDGCGKRRARATNTREMYGKGRRGY